MRRSARALLLALTVTVGEYAGAAWAGPARAAAPAASANSTLLRLIALGHRQNVSYAASYAAFGEQFTQRADLRAARFSAIDNATGQLRPALIAAGELAGLPSAFIGSRGAAARDAATVEAAMLEVGLSWGLQAAAYAARYGAALQPANAIELALSDVMWRGFNDTFSTLAVELQAYVVAGTVGPRIVPSTDPSDIAFFGDPDLAPGQSVVYLPAGPQVYNTVYVFAPDGGILAAVDKHWLTDLEVSMLALTPGNVSANMVQQLALAAGPGVPPLPLCVAVCWDGFHPDVVQWLDGQGCRLMVQPSYNMQAWAANTSAGAGVWQPADWSTGPLGMLAPTATTNISTWINPMVTGNLFDLVVDGQSAIVARAPTLPTTEYIGMPLPPTSPYNFNGSFLALAPWAFPDPVALPLAQRRAALAALAAELAPGSGSPSEDAYADSVIWADWAWGATA
jgi:predicted amidohydrolase